jgi:acetolactate synthase small subunit
MRIGRVIFVIKAENRPDVLARVVALFHRLNVEIDALYMVRRRSSETIRIRLTIEANEERCRRIEAHLYKVVQVTSVKTARRSKEVLTETRDD